MKLGKELNTTIIKEQQESHIVKMSFEVDIVKYQKDLEKNFTLLGISLPGIRDQEKIITTILQYMITNKVALFGDSLRDLVVGGELSLSRNILKTELPTYKKVTAKTGKGKDVIKYPMIVEPYDTAVRTFGVEILKLFDFYENNSAKKRNANYLATLDLVKIFIKNGLHNSFGARGSVIILADKPYYFNTYKSKRKWDLLKEGDCVAANTPVLILTIKDE